MEMVCVMPVMGNDIFKLSSQGQLDWIEILSTDENFNRMSSMIRLEDISLMEYQHINNLLTTRVVSCYSSYRQSWSV